MRKNLIIPFIVNFKERKVKQIFYFSSYRVTDFDRVGLFLHEFEINPCQITFSFFVRNKKI
jgi:hypothetical protein